MTEIMKSTAVVVNDDSGQSKALCGLLKEEGFVVQSYSSAEDALDIIAASVPPKLIITDLHMRGMNGWRLCKLLRSSEYESYNRTPLVITTATFSGGHARDVAIDLGANGFFHLPLETEPLRMHVRSIIQGRKAPFGKSVLIVEDEAGQAAVIKRAFEARGDRVRVAGTGVEALTMVQELSPDIAIIDYHLPDGKGDYLLPEIKKSGSNTVAIIITADVNPNLAAGFIRLGADGYVRKPLDPDYLLALADKASREMSLLKAEELLESRSKQLLDAEERFHAFFESIPEFVAICDRQGVILHINKTGAQWLEEKPENIKGRSFEVFMADESKKFFADSLWRNASKKGGVPDFVVTTGSGKLLRCEAKVCSFIFDGTPALLVILTNIDERRQLECQLLQAQKMEAVGLLAGGVAHDFNNMLTTIMGYSNMLKDGSPEESFVYEAAKSIEEASRHATDLTKQLLKIARQEKTRNVPVNVHSQINDVVCFLERTISKDISVVRDLRAENYVITGDPGQIYQVVLNLSVNARDAMPNGGALSFATEIAGLSKTQKQMHPEIKDTKYIRIVVKDTGEGISREHLSKIFDPFFTTKPSDKGTGMGLAMVYGIVKNHGGFVEVSSTVGVGTTFSLYLPLARDQALADDKPEHAGPVKGEGLVLVVDDEQAILKMSSVMLKSLGYEVAVASGGEKAIEYFKENHKSVDVVIMDMSMPDMDGITCLRELRKIRPDIRAVFSTGHGVDDWSLEIAETGVKNVVQKPYTVAEISTVLSEAMR